MSLMTVSCVKTDKLESALDSLEAKIAALEQELAKINDNAIAISHLLKNSTSIIDIESTDTGYIIELSDGTAITISDGISTPGIVPVIGIDCDGNWIMSLDNGKTFEPISSTPEATPDTAATPILRVGEDGCWEYSMNEGDTWVKICDGNGKPVSAVDGNAVAGVKTFFQEIKYQEGDDFMTIILADGRTLSIAVERDFYFEITGYKDAYPICLEETINFEVRSSKVSDVAIQAPEGWNAAFDGNILSVTSPLADKEGSHVVSVVVVSEQGFVKHISLDFALKPVSIDKNACEQWNDFIAGNDDNVLVDFSYAGYNHGETAPADVWSLGYKIYNVMDYGAIPDDDKSDREAFLNTLKAALGKDYISEGSSLTFEHKDKADAIIYFPEGRFILHNEDDDVNGKSQSIIIRSGNLIIKGAGRDKTFIIMENEMLAEDENIYYSSPDMIQIKHNSSFSSYMSAVSVTSDAAKGDYSIETSTVSSIAPGDWVCLHVKNNDTDFIEEELAPYTAEAGWAIYSEGVEVIEYHQVKSVEGSVITFVEPIMHDVDKTRNWEVKSYPHYENVGIEDLTFKGNAKADFNHHGSWQDDGGFKPISMNRLVNSWIRRVGFESVSEACSIINSANVSAYDITLSGNRGHAAIRSQASTRVLIAATTDQTSDYKGNYHAVGVSRNSVGTVLWRNVWGEDSCFESHATQPRATLIDCCSGGWMQGRAGGDTDQLPHHLDDLIIWNFDATGKDMTSMTDYAGFTWWEAGSTVWRFLPPVIVGFQSEYEVIFDISQIKTLSSQGIHVNPESLYEAQLRHRLGAVPAWLNTLKR